MPEKEYKLHFPLMFFTKREVTAGEEHPPEAG